MPGGGRMITTTMMMTPTESYHVIHFSLSSLKMSPLLVRLANGHSADRPLSTLTLPASAVTGRCSVVKPRSLPATTTPIVLRNICRQPKGSTHHQDDEIEFLSIAAAVCLTIDHALCITRNL